MLCLKGWFSSSNTAFFKSSNHNSEFEINEKLLDTGNLFFSGFTTYVNVASPKTIDWYLASVSSPVKAIIPGLKIFDIWEKAWSVFKVPNLDSDAATISAKVGLLLFFISFLFHKQIV